MLPRDWIFHGKTEGFDLWHKGSVSAVAEPTKTGIFLRVPKLLTNGLTVETYQGKTRANEQALP